jgi:hypothetical protein
MISPNSYTHLELYPRAATCRIDDQSHRNPQSINSFTYSMFPCPAAKQRIEFKLISPTTSAFDHHPHYSSTLVPCTFTHSRETEVRIITHELQVEQRAGDFYVTIQCRSFDDVYIAFARPKHIVGKENIEYGLILSSVAVVSSLVN